MITIVGAKIRRETVNNAMVCCGVPISKEKLSLGGELEGDSILFSDVTDCNIDLLSKRVVFTQSTIRNCRFKAKGGIADLRWNGVLFDHCRFEGIYKLLPLGVASGAMYVEQHEFGVVGCDFSKARLDMVSMHCIEFDQCVLPTKPHIIFNFYDEKRKAAFCPDKLQAARDLIRFKIPNEYQYPAMIEATITRGGSELNIVAVSRHYLEKYKKFPPVILDPFYDACRKLDFVWMNF
jgi:hypothetical protein